MCWSDVDRPVILGNRFVVVGDGGGSGGGAAIGAV